MNGRKVGTYRAAGWIRGSVKERRTSKEERGGRKKGKVGPHGMKRERRKGWGFLGSKGWVIEGDEMGKETHGTD